MPTIGTTPAIAQGFADYMKLLAATLQELDNEQLARIVEVLLEAQRQGKKVLTMGTEATGAPHRTSSTIWPSTRSPMTPRPR